ncbi:hypothetical protein C8Q80DRAFT_1271390 [Daedaleopsis nitida]|nr:hypothetical protein C8Q80DRAFT_1271390 [Daedaleopsis nitida]
MQSDYDNTSSSTGMNSEYTDGPAAGTHPEAFNEGQDRGGYSEMQSSQGSGGIAQAGAGTMGSGVAGGYEGNNGNQATGNQATGEKKDWLDKGIAAIGNKMGVNISDKNADAAGDFANKEFRSKEGRGIPGVQ